MIEQGLLAYFNHKVDEYGVYFFDPDYYEKTEPFLANLREVKSFCIMLLKSGFKSTIWLAYFVH